MPIERLVTLDGGNIERFMAHNGSMTNDMIILVACVVTLAQSFILMRMTQRWLILGRVLDEAETSTSASEPEVDTSRA